MPMSQLKGTILLDDKMWSPGLNVLMAAGLVLFLLAIEVLVRNRTWRAWRLLASALRDAQGEEGLWGLLKHFAGLVFILAALVSILSVPLIVEIMLVVQDAEIQHICAVLASLFAILASALSFQEIHRHLGNYSMSRVQKHICRILLMVPIYAIDAAVSIRFMQKAVILNTVRELYEAFAVWSFMSLIIEFLHNEAVRTKAARRDAVRTESPARIGMPADNSFVPDRVSSVQNRMDLIAELLATQPDEPHIVGVRQLLRCTPKCCGIRQPWTMGSQFLHRCRLGVLQFVPMQILVSILCIVLEQTGSYQEGVWINQKIKSPSYGRPTGFGCTNLIRIISCTYALYCLVYFYKGTRKLLAAERVGYNISPLAKFMSIKLVVFATFWQKMVLTIGTKLGHLLGRHFPEFYHYNFQTLWVDILVGKFNSVEYFVSKGDDYDDGQTHHGCDCVGYQEEDTTLKPPGPTNKYGFIYGNHNQSWGGHTDSGYCCNGIVQMGKNNILPAYEDLVSGNVPDSYCNFGMVSNQSLESQGGFNSLWCPINVSSCHKNAKLNSSWIEV